MSTWPRASTTPIPTISTRWARTDSRAAAGRMRMSPTGTRRGLSGFTLGEILVVLMALVIVPAGVTARLEPPPEDLSNPSPTAQSASRTSPAGEDTLRFLPDAPSPGGVIVLTDARGRERRVVVAPRTAVVSVEAR